MEQGREQDPHQAHGRARVDAEGRQVSREQQHVHEMDRPQGARADRDGAQALAGLMHQIGGPLLHQRHHILLWLSYRAGARSSVLETTLDECRPLPATADRVYGVDLPRAHWFGVRGGLRRYS